jgi:nondiscriminating glutamyl-tRNA synthetase
VIETVRDELTALAGIGEHIALFFDSRYRMTSEAKQVLDTENARKVVLSFGEYLDTAAGLPLEIYAAAIKHARESSGIKGRDLFMPVRAALTGKVKGPELEKVFALLGKASAVKRLKQAYP